SPGGEDDAGQVGDEELGGVTHPEGKLDVADLVVEVDARGAPHDDFLGPVALEELDGAPAHARGGAGVAVLVMYDAAAVGRAADGDVVEAEAIKEGGDGLDQVRGAQRVAAEVE